MDAGSISENPPCNAQAASANSKPIAILARPTISCHYPASTSRGGSFSDDQLAGPSNVLYQNQCRSLSDDQSAGPSTVLASPSHGGSFSDYQQAGPSIVLASPNDSLTFNSDQPEHSSIVVTDPNHSWSFNSEEPAYSSSLSSSSIGMPVSYDQSADSSSVLAAPSHSQSISNSPPEHPPLVRLFPRQRRSLSSDSLVPRLFAQPIPIRRLRSLSTSRYQLQPLRPSPRFIGSLSSLQEEFLSELHSQDMCEQYVVPSDTPCPVHTPSVSCDQTVPCYLPADPTLDRTAPIPIKFFSIIPPLTVLAHSRQYQLSLTPLGEPIIPIENSNQISSVASVSSVSQASSSGAGSLIRSPPPEAANHHVIATTSGASAIAEPCPQPEPDKLLIFTTGSLAFTPHEIGIQEIRRYCIDTQVRVSPEIHTRIMRRRAEKELKRQGVLTPRDEVDMNKIEENFDSIDHLIDLKGQIIGMALSPDKRFLYVNCRAWIIDDDDDVIKPLFPPIISRDIEIHVIDLTTRERVGTVLKAHKAFTNRKDCFFIFLDVSDKYVTSGAEDCKAYIWDRYHEVWLSQLPHSAIVNCSAFNPVDPEMLVSVGDDNKIKVWRSRNKVRHYKIDATFLPKGEERRCTILG